MTRTEKYKAIVSAWDDGKKFMMADGEYTAIVVGKEMTGSAYVITNGVIAPGSFVPDHYHKREDQTFHVVEGSLEAKIGDEVFLIGAGDTIFCPRGVSHYMKNTGSDTAKLISYIIPGDWAEDFMAETSRQNREQAFDPKLIEERFGVVYI
jgi:quercetin dioxygenase-like cupin family protein